jgi:hypothetical protein
MAAPGVRRRGAQVVALLGWRDAVLRPCPQRSALARNLLAAWLAGTSPSQLPSYALWRAADCEDARADTAWWRRAVAEEAPRHRWRRLCGALRARSR